MNGIIIYKTFLIKKYARLQQTRHGLNRFIYWQYPSNSKNLSLSSVRTLEKISHENAIPTHASFPS